MRLRQGSLKEPLVLHEIVKKRMTCVRIEPAALPQTEYGFLFMKFRVTKGLVITGKALTTRPRSRVISRDENFSDYIKSESRFSIFKLWIHSSSRLGVYGLCSWLPLGAYGPILAVRDWVCTGPCSRLPPGAYGPILAVRDWVCTGPCSRLPLGMYRSIGSSRFCPYGLI
jgi:hypothetical protein